MTAVVEFTVPADAFELGRTLRIPGVQVALFQLIPRGNRFVPYLWVQSDDGEFLRFESTLEDDYRVADVTAVEGGDAGGECLYRVEWATELNGLFDGFRSHGLSIEYARNTPETWEFRVFNREHGNLEAFQTYCDDHDIPIQVERVYHPTAPDAAPETDLTREQREALVTAFEQGYFDVPQQTSLEELGEVLGISRQAASDRIHRGMRTLVSDVVLVDDPADS